MTDYIKFDVDQGIKAASGEWYRCVQLLGAGGNAVTFLVLCSSGPNTGVLFALKVFRKLSEPHRRKRFLEEVDFLLHCSHPALMRVYDRGVFIDDDDEFPFVVAEYLPQRLYDVMRTSAATTMQKISYSLQLLSALTYLQNLDPSVVHRDIKPQNIFVKGGSCVLGDLGLMKLLDGNAETDRDIFKESIGPGMPFFYRTPDLIAYAKQESDITPKSDVFQLGLVLAELFSGKNPAIRPTEHLDPYRQQPIRQIPGGLGAGIARMLYKMLVRDPDLRPNASDLMDGWHGLFQQAVERAHELDGRAF